MPILFPFGKPKQKNWSVEQLLLNDYSYFNWALHTVKSPHVLSRMKYLHDKSNNYESVIPCAVNPHKRARFVSLYFGPGGDPVMNLGFAYATQDMWQDDPKFTDQVHKTSIHPLGLDIVLLSRTKAGQRYLSEQVQRSMGIDPNERKTKEFLEEFFNKLPLRTYNGPKEPQLVQGELF